MQLLAQAGDGSLRDALSLLDQLLAYGDGKALEADARAMLGTVRARPRGAPGASCSRPATPPRCSTMRRRSMSARRDYAQLLEQLASLLERVALKQLVPDYEGDELHPRRAARSASRRAVRAEDVQLFYQTAILGRRDLALAPDARTGFRMTLIRMLAFRPRQRRAARRLPARRARARATEAARRPAATPRPLRLAAGRRSSRSHVRPRAASGGGTTGRPSSRRSICRARRGSWPATACCSAREGATVRLALDPRSASLRTRALEDKLAQALSRHFGDPVRLEIERARGGGGHAGARRSERAAGRSAAPQARAAFEADPTVGAFKERFGASVLPDSVRPVKPELIDASSAEVNPMANMNNFMQAGAGAAGQHAEGAGRDRQPRGHRRVRRRHGQGDR